MQSILVNPKIKNKILSSLDYEKIMDKKEFLLFSDNILEGITLLNYLTNNNDLLQFAGIVYEPIDQPIYIFKDNSKISYCIKICGSFNKWSLPDDVNAIKSFVDLPDYIFYSIKNKKAILAGENTETASVGNSQWQREGRKVAAAKLGVPFIYQTFYSGKDESQDTLREPNSLQVYNQILYSARYKTPSFVAYFENNFKGSKTRDRIPFDSQNIFSNYIKSVLLADIDTKKQSIKVKYEKEFFNHMLSYIIEGKYKKKDGGTIESFARITKDLPSLSYDTHKGILENSANFVEDLIDWIYSINDSFEANYSIADLDSKKFVAWNPSLKATNKKQIQPLLDYSLSTETPIKSFAKNGKVGIIKTKILKPYLSSKYPGNEEAFNDVFTEDETVIFPIRIWKISNSKLTLSPDPESGEIVSFCELLAYDINGNKKRNIFGTHIVQISDSIKYENVEGQDGNNKINKAIANYFDLLILSNGEIISKFKKPLLQKTGYIPQNIKSAFPKSTSEEMAIVSTYLNLSTIKSDWDLCFIHTHHSSWQQIQINQVQQKINRVSTKLDLIMQQNNIFMLAEGKDKYQSILSDRKIKHAMKYSSKTIDEETNNNNLKFNAFLYNLQTTPAKDPEYYADSEELIVQGGIERGHFNDIAYEENFVVIIVYTDKANCTKFRLVFSHEFEPNLMNQLQDKFL